jgi:hypothetical protein
MRVAIPAVLRGFAIPSQLGASVHVAGDFDQFGILQHADVVGDHRQGGMAGDALPDSSKLRAE